jgi:hypothetical protein
VTEVIEPRQKSTTTTTTTTTMTTTTKDVHQWKSERPHRSLRCVVQRSRSFRALHRAQQWEPVQEFFPPHSIDLHATLEAGRI